MCKDRYSENVDGFTFAILSKSICSIFTFDLLYLDSLPVMLTKSQPLKPTRFQTTYQNNHKSDKVPKESK